MKARYFVGLLLGLSACATYKPQPLADSPAILRAPDRALLKPQAIDLDAPLTMEAAAALAVLANPDLKAMRDRAGVAKAQIFAAGLLPDPTFSAGIDHLISGPDPVDNLTAALGLNLHALMARPQLLAEARAHAEQVRMDIAWAEWQTAGLARMTAARVYYLEKMATVSDASQAAGEARFAQVLASVGPGDIGADHLQALSLAAQDADQAARQTRRNLAAARLELNRLLGLPPGYVLHIAPPQPLPDKASQPLAVEKLFGVATKYRLDLQALRRGYAAQEAVVHKAVLDQFPGLDLTINSARDTSRNVLLGPAISFTLPLWNRNRGGIAIERATRLALKGEYEARLFQTRAEIAAAAANLSISVRQYAAQTKALPAVAALARESRAAAGRGDMPSVTAEVAEQSLRDRQNMLYQSALDMAEQATALELLVGAKWEQWN